MIQREAVRAILNIGTERAYRVLEEALATGTERSRDAIMLAISMQRDERATPLFAYILRHIDHRTLTSIYLQRHRIAGGAARPRGHRAARGGAGQGRMVGAAAQRGASHGVGGRPRADRNPRGVQRARNGRRGVAARPGGRAPVSREPRPGGWGSAHDRAARPAGRRTAAQLRRHPAIGAAVLQGPPDHHAQPRVVLGRDSAAAHPGPARRHRPDRRRGHRGRHADRQGRRDGSARPAAAPERPRAHHHRARRDARRARAVRRSHDGPRAPGRRRRARSRVRRHAAHPRRPRDGRRARRPANWPTSRRSSGCTTKP